MHNVFVYGSLMRGFGNHGLLESSAFISEATAEGLRLYTLGAFPAVLSGDDGDSPVRGEVYSVDDETLARLDRLEGHPNFYRRERKEVWVENYNAYLPCYYYHFQSSIQPSAYIESGSWRHARTTQANALRSQAS